MKQITFIICTLIFFILNASNVWALPNCVGTWNPSNWHNCIGSYTWNDGTKYIGEYKNGEKNGQGTVTWTSGDKYFGEWINDRRSGQGTYTWANGDIYNGRFKDGKLTGHGTITYPDGNKYVGKYNNGKRHGQGTFTWGDGEWSGDKYVGEWKNDDRTGQGTYTYSNGRKEVGEFKNNKLNGYAIKYFANGSIDQEGIFKDDEFLYAQTKTLPSCPSSGYFHNCFGTYTWDDGAKYIGEWQNDKTHGQGTQTWVSGEKYVGEWQNGKRHGHGTYTFSNGDKYVGKYKNDNRNGQGTFTYSNGDKYVGEYKDGDINGFGTFTFGSNSEWAGDKYVGEFENDKFYGQGTYTFSNGSKHVGTWKNNKLNGYAIKYFANGSIDQEGIFKDDEFLYAQTKTLPSCPSSGYFHNCFGTYTWDDGAKYIGEWQNNKSHGQGTQTWANGDKYVGEWQNDNRTGQGTQTWANGDKYAGEWQNDKRNGQGTYTWGDGEWAGDKYVGLYKDGVRHGQGTYTHSNGDTYEGGYKNNLMDGQGTYTYANGRKEVGEFKNDALNGYAIKYFANGSIDQEGIFKDDEFLYAQETSPNIIIKDNQDDKVINASSGSGFAVSSDGYVITNNHVIEGCQEVIVHTKEKDIKTRIISFDPQNDLALLKGDFQPKTVFALSNNRPELLQDIYVAGYPFGNAISSSIKVTKGIISSLTGIGNNFSNIQIDAALQSGNSGGPIIDDNGNVIAVAVSKLDAKYMLENFGSIPENTNFGIKSSVVKSILDSNDVARPDANQSEISKTMLGKMISSGTYYISCWMTQAQIELLKSKKVLFEGLN